MKFKFRSEEYRCYFVGQILKRITLNIPRYAKGHTFRIGPYIEWPDYKSEREEFYIVRFTRREVVTKRPIVETWIVAKSQFLDTDKSKGNCDA